jgi:hypothetical protein
VEENINCRNDFVAPKLVTVDYKLQHSSTHEELYASADPESHQFIPHFMDNKSVSQVIFSCTNP